MAMLLSIITGAEGTLKGITPAAKQPMISTDMQKYFIGDASTLGGIYIGGVKTVKDMARYVSTIYDANSAIWAQDSKVFVDGSLYAAGTLITVVLKTSIIGMFEPELYVKNITPTLQTANPGGYGWPTDAGQLTSPQLAGIFGGVEDAADSAAGWKLFGAQNGHITLMKDSGSNWFVLEGSFLNTGTIGPQGDVGVSGYSGTHGVSGYSGYSGPVGTSGYSGYSGPVGTSGYSGYSG